MNFKQTLTRIFFPYKCPLCHEIIPIEKSECDCEGNTVQRISEKYCSRCGADKYRCTCDITKAESLGNIAGVYYYGGKIKAQLALFKFGRKKHFAKDFSLAMSERVAKVYSDISFDAVTFVPSSESSQKERGFNQSELLARGVGERLFIPTRDILQKVRETERQHELSAKERLTNLDGAFSLRDDAYIKGETILLCDDIKTTGTTLKKCCEALYEGGAKKVCCIVLAVTDYMVDF